MLRDEMLYFWPQIETKIMKMELVLKYVEHTLPHVVQLLGKNVHLKTFVEDKKIVFSYDGKKTSRKFV